jgi:ribonuclease BN (tRNA processing enzyme)
MNFGHSTPSQVDDLAARARVRSLYLFHHDPDHTDVVVDAKAGRVRELLATRGAATTVVAPTELAAFEI